MSDDDTSRLELLMGWAIASGPDEIRSGGNGVRWRWRLRDLDRDETKALSIDVSEDALASRILSEEAARAIMSQGRSAIADVIDWRDLPDRIEISDERVEPSGGTEPDEGTPLARIEKWFDDQNVVLRITPLESGWSASLLPKEETPPDETPTPLRVRWSVVGKSDLDAAKRAVERYLRIAASLED